MRAILLGLVLLNALYWAWSHWIDTPPPATARSTEFADLPTLRLIFEVEGTDGGTADGAELNLADVQPLIAMDADPDSSDRMAVPGPVASTTDLPDPSASDRGAVGQGPADSDSSASGSSAPVPPVSIPFASGQATPIFQLPGEPGPIPPDTGPPKTGPPETGPPETGPPETGSPETGQSEAELSDTASAASGSEASGGATTGVTATEDGVGAVVPESPPAATESPQQGTSDAAVATDGDATGNQPLLASSVVMASDPIANPARCDSVGPFLSLRQARAAVTLLNDAGVPTQQRVEEAEVWVGHWVHLPPYPTRDAAVAVVERLRREGVEDIYIETSEELRHSISLGLFSDIEGAEIRAGKVRKLGVRPQIVDRRRDGLVYWVDLELRAGSSIDIGMFDVLPHQTLRIESVACTGRLNTRE